MLEGKGKEGLDKDPTFAVEFQAIAGIVTLFTNCLCSYPEIVEDLKSEARECSDPKIHSMFANFERKDRAKLINSIEQRK
jgi:hypothetical protein